MLKLLLLKRGIVDGPSEDGLTPLHAACQVVLISRVFLIRSTAKYESIGIVLESFIEVSLFRSAHSLSYRFANVFELSRVVCKRSQTPMGTALPGLQLRTFMYNSRVTYYSDM